MVCCVCCVAGECDDDSSGEVASWNQGLVLQAWYVLYVLYHHNCYCVCVFCKSKRVCLCGRLLVAMFILVSTLLFFPFFFISILQCVLYSILYPSIHSLPPLLPSTPSTHSTPSLHSFPPSLLPFPPPLYMHRGA